MTRAALAGMGLPVPDQVPTRAPAPTTAPALLVNPAGRFRHKIAFFTFGSESTRKPRGVTGLELWLMSPDVAAGEPFADWTFLDVLTRPGTIRTVPLPGGKMAHWRGRWRNSRGETGPWSETVECTVMG